MAYSNRIYRIAGDIPSLTSMKNNSLILIAKRDFASKKIPISQYIKSSFFKKEVLNREIFNYHQRMRILENKGIDISVMENDQSWISDSLSQTSYNALKSIPSAQIILSSSEGMTVSNLNKFFNNPQVTDQQKSDMLEIIGFRTSQGYLKAVDKYEQYDDLISRLNNPAPYGFTKQGKPKKKPGRKPNLKKRQEERKEKQRKQKIRQNKKDNPIAPYGRTKEGKPKKKPGRPKTSPEDKLVDKLLDKYAPGFITEEDIEKFKKIGIPNLKKWVDWQINYNKKHPERPIKLHGELNPTLEDIADNLDWSLATILESPPDIDQSPEDYFRESLPKFDPSDIIEKFEKSGFPPEVKREVKKILEHWDEKDIDEQEDLLKWMEKKLRRKIIYPLNVDDISPEEMLRRGASRKVKKEFIATENWFKAARAEFSLNIARYPQLIDLAKRVANKDPSLLFDPTTEINLWYNLWGWGRADDLIDNLEAVSGLKVDDSIEGYKNTADRNKRIKRFYANQLRFRIREELIAKGWEDRKTRDVELKRRMKQLGYEY